ncbi:DUF3592 domain-containing protein [Anatilimnocola floriformis]|uniref:DUF3592 domain-containing protein n=1 Tax=Anatilimnocola floriformis TaxID=2948575 RepID=UPI0020C44662|nr:DUF3592 domain-containing protein [Anatilimnocola floriformis]
MALEPQREVPAELRSEIIQINALIFGGPVLLLFLLYALRLCGIDPLNKRGDEEGVSSNLYLAFAIIGTLICVPWCLWRIRKSLYLARYGVEVIGQMTSIGLVQMKGMRSMHYRYTYLRSTYAGATEIVASAVERYQQSPQIRLLVDPAKPQRAMLYNEVLGPGL